MLHKSPLPLPQLGGRCAVHTMTGVDDTLDAAQLYSAALLVFRRDGMGKQMRLKAFLKNTSNITGKIRVHVRMLIPRRDFMLDYLDNNAERIYACATMLEGLLHQDFSAQMLHDEPRVMIEPADLPPGCVMFKVGGAVTLPAIDDTPLATVELAYRSGNGAIRQIPLAGYRYFRGQPSQLDVIEKPFAVYFPKEYLLFSFCQELGVTLIPGGEIQGMPARIGINLRSDIMSLEWPDQDRREERPLQRQADGEITVCVEKAGLPPPGAEPEALILRIQPCAPMSLDVPSAPVIDIEAARSEPQRPSSLHPFSKRQEPSLDFAPSPPQPLKESEIEEEDTNVPCGLVNDAGSAEHTEGPTLIAGPKDAKKALPCLQLVGIALQSLPAGSGLLRYTIHFDANGNIQAQRDANQSTTLAVVAAAHKAIFAAPGSEEWQPLAPPTVLPLPGGNGIPVAPVDDKLSAEYHAFLMVPTETSRPMPPERRQVVGRGATGQDKVTLGLLAGASLERDDNGIASLETLGLSREHFSLTLNPDGTAAVTMASGKTPVWALDADLRPVADLLPHSTNILLVRSGNHLLAGPYLLKINF